MRKPKKVKVKNGFKWEVCFLIDGVGSKKIRRRFDKKIDAELFVKNFYKNGLDLPEKKIRPRTLKTEYEFWLKIKADELTSSHLGRVSGIIGKVIEVYGDVEMERIDNVFLSELRKFLLAKQYASATVNRWTNSITTIVNFSFRNNRIKTNPCVGFGLLNEFREEMNFWEEDEVKEFLSFAKNKYQDTDRYWVYVVYLLVLNTGIRAGELWGLKVKDLNFNRRFINIERQLLSQTKKLASTKGKNIRKVPLNKTLACELRGFVRARELDELIFVNGAKNSINHHNFRHRFFLPDIKSSEMRVIRFHDLRHTALTLMVESGINLRVVQAIAGHADIQTTMKYVHLLGDSIEKVSETFSLF